MWQNGEMEATTPNICSGGYRSNTECLEMFTPSDKLKGLSHGPIQVRSRVGNVSGWGCATVTNNVINESSRSHRRRSDREVTKNVMLAMPLVGVTGYKAIEVFANDCDVSVLLNYRRENYCNMLHLAYKSNRECDNKGIWIRFMWWPLINIYFSLFISSRSHGHDVDH